MKIINSNKINNFRFIYIIQTKASGFHFLVIDPSNDRISPNSTTRSLFIMAAISYFCIAQLPSPPPPLCALRIDVDNNLLNSSPWIELPFLGIDRKSVFQDNLGSTAHPPQSDFVTAGNNHATTMPTN